MAQTPDPDGNQDGQRDLDAEFAALMGDVEIPDDLSTVDDLEAPEGTRSGQDRGGSNEDGPASVADPGQAGPQGVSPHDVPHNTYHPLSEADGGVQAPDGSSRLTDAQEAQIAAAADSLSSYGSGESGDQAPRAVKVTVVMTPLNRADGLAGMCSLLDLDCTVVPSSNGAFAVKQFVSAHSDWDVAELLGGSDSDPAGAAVPVRAEGSPPIIDTAYWTEQPYCSGRYQLRPPPIPRRTAGAPMRAPGKQEAAKAPSRPLQAGEK